jgi:hypothetical protein
VGGGAAGDAARDPFFAMEAARHLDGRLVLHELDLVQVAEVEDVRLEARPDPRDLVRPRLRRLAPPEAVSTGEAAAPPPPRRRGAEIALEVAADAGDRAAGADPATKQSSFPPVACQISRAVVR